MRRTYINRTSPPRKVKSAKMQDETKKKKNKKKNIPPHQIRDTKKIKEAPEPPSEYIQKKLFGPLRTPATCATNSSWITGTSTTKFYCAMGATCKCTRAVTASKRFQTGEWLCAGCEDGVSNLIENGRGMCALCPTPKGALARIKPKSKFSTNWRAPGYHAHVVCALTLPEISFSKAVDNDKKGLGIWIFRFAHRRLEAYKLADDVKV